MKKTDSMGSRKLPLLLLLAICILPAWAYHEMQTNQQAAIESAEQLDECRKLTGTIKQLREKPLQASNQLLSVAQLARSIEEAAEQAKIPLEQLVQIDPRAARRIAKTPYKEQPTHIELRGITLRQLTTLLHVISKKDPGTCITEIRLHAPRLIQEKYQKKEPWNVEITLTSLLFVP